MECVIVEKWCVYLRRKAYVTNMKIRPIITTVTAGNATTAPNPSFSDPNDFSSSILLVYFKRTLVCTISLNAQCINLTMCLAHQKCYLTYQTICGYAYRVDFKIASSWWYKIRLYWDSFAARVWFYLPMVKREFFLCLMWILSFCCFKCYPR